MSKDTFERDKIAADLRTVARLLVEKRFITDPSPLESAANKCSRSKKPGQWGYDFSSLIFLLPDSEIDTIPSSVADLRLSLQVEVVGRTRISGDEDPLLDLMLDVHIVGKRNVSEDHHSLLAAWHLDRNKRESGDGEQTFVHPWYHIQFGGHRLKKSTANFGDSLILDTPRIAHPPLDGLLGVDYILTNYYPESVGQSLRNVREYLNIMKRARERLWCPYVKLLAKPWRLDSPNGNSRRAGIPEWHPFSLWPQLYPE
jgi:hypothetical protein